jgi:hypothetical protein
MSSEMIECFQLDFMRNIPLEIAEIQDQNFDLIRSNKQLKKSLYLLGLGLGILLIANIWMNYERKRKEELA